MINILRLFVLVLALSTAGAVNAQTRVQGVECGVEREVQAGALTERTYNRLTRIYEEIGEEKYAEAYAGLQELLESTRRDDYEKATIYQAMAYIRAQQERYQEAIDLFKRAIELDRMPNNQHFDMVLQVAQLYYSIERYREALDELDLWFCMTPDDQKNKVNVWVMKASIHAQIEEFRQALEAIDRAIALADEPREQWYQLKLGMHFELKEWNNAVGVLKILINMNPTRKDYWIQLASVYSELEQQRDSMATLALAHRRGLLDRQSEYLQLASLQQEFDAPRKAAEVLQEGLEQGIVESTRRNWEMTAGAWYEARELDRALDAYEQAGAQSMDGKIDLQRAYILVDLERWDEAKEALSRALELGGLRESQVGNAYLLLGNAHASSGNLDAALDAFNEALKYGRVERAAREWINHIQQERSRQAGS